MSIRILEDPEFEEFRAIEVIRKIIFNYASILVEEKLGSINNTLRSLNLFNKFSKKYFKENKISSDILISNNYSEWAIFLNKLFEKEEDVFSEIFIDLNKRYDNKDPKLLAELILVKLME